MSKVRPVFFLRQVKQEIAKVIWPTRKETLVSTLMVVLFTLFSTLFFFVVDQLIALLMQMILGLGA